MVAKLSAINRHFASHVALHAHLGIELTELGDGTARMRLPWSDKLVGDPHSGLLHGGALSILVDGCAGAAAFQGLAEPTSLATLDLRVDHFKPAPAGRDLFAEARCVRMTNSVAFVRATAWHAHPDDPIATATATFMIHTHVPGIIRE